MIDIEYRLGIFMPKQISEEEAHLLGIDTLHQEMDNGERRFRLVSSDGSSYIRTEASNNGGCQKSHYHKSLREFYVVQKRMAGLHGVCL